MAREPDPYALDEQLCFALYRASRAVIRSYATLLEPLGITYLQYLTLLVLWRGDGVTVKHLGERLALDSATLTPLLKRLEQQGLVTRARDAVDGRAVLVRLTAAGKKLRTAARHVPRSIACRTGYDPDDAGSIKDLVRLRKELVALSQKVEAPPVD